MKTINASLVCLAVMVLTACGPARLSKTAIESGAMAALTASAGMQAPQITCPSDMPATVGASQVCSITLTAGVYDVTVTITAVDSNTSVATYSVVVASAPRP